MGTGTGTGMGTKPDRSMGTGMGTGKEPDRSTGTDTEPWVWVQVRVGSHVDALWV